MMLAIKVYAKPYSIITVPQLSMVTGVPEQQIYNMGKSGKNSVLDICYPFRYRKGAQIVTGPMFIVENGKCDKFITKHI